MANIGFKGVDVRQTGSEIISRAFLTDNTGAVLATGTTTISFVELQSDGTVLTYDFNDNTFKAGACTTPTANMTHRPINNAGTNVGLWTYALATLTGFTKGAIYQSIISNSGSSPVVQIREWQYGSEQGDAVMADVSTGVAHMAVSLASILGTVLTETAGWLAAGFKKFFNVSATPSSTMDVIATVTNVTNDVGITQAGADKVWASVARTLTSFGTLIADIWSYATRILTAGVDVATWAGKTVTTAVGNDLPDVNTKALAGAIGQASNLSGIVDSTSIQADVKYWNHGAVTKSATNNLPDVNTKAYNDKIATTAVGNDLPDVNAKALAGAIGQASNLSGIVDSTSIQADIYALNHNTPSAAALKTAANTGIALETNATANKNEIEALIATDNAPARYCSLDGNNTTGLSWATAYHTLAQGLSDLALTGGILHADGNIWQEDITIPDNVDFIGHDGRWNTPANNDFCYIKGLAVGSVAPTITMNPNSSLRNVHFGKQSNGGGNTKIVLAYSGAKIIDCHQTSNAYATGLGLTDLIVLVGADQVIDSNMFSGTTSIDSIRIISSSYMDNVRIWNNFFQTSEDYIYATAGKFIGIRNNDFHDIQTGKYGLNGAPDRTSMLDNRWRGNGALVNPSITQIVSAGNIKTTDLIFSQQAVRDAMTLAATVSSVEDSIDDKLDDISEGVPVTGTVTLATSQPNYAPSKAGDKMDIVDVPNATGLTALAVAVWASATRTLTSFGTLVADTASAVWSAITRSLTDKANFTLTSAYDPAKTAAQATDVQKLIIQGFGRLEFDIPNSKAYIWDIGGAARKYQSTLTDSAGAPVTVNTVGPINMTEWTTI